MVKHLILAMPLPYRLLLLSYQHAYQSEKFNIAFCAEIIFD
jgi:hypothetical protein